MKKLAIYFTNQFLKINPSAEAEKEIYIYAFECIFTQLFIYTLLCIIALVTKTFFLMCLTILYILFLRGQTSGYHANNIFVCTFLSLLTCLSCVFLWGAKDLTFTLL